jgi:HSP20 family protein
MQQWRPSVDISQNNQEWCVEAELPGVNKDDIDVQVHDHHLILRAEMRKEQPEEGEGRQYHHRERRYGFFERVLPLPENVDEEHIACDFKDGVLTLHLPKLEQAKQEARRIPITTGGTGTEVATPTAKESKETASTGTQGATAQKKAA